MPGVEQIIAVRGEKTSHKMWGPHLVRAPYADTRGAVTEPL